MKHETLKKGLEEAGYTVSLDDRMTSSYAEGTFCFQAWHKNGSSFNWIHIPLKDEMASQVRVWSALYEYPGTDSRDWQNGNSVKSLPKALEFLDLAHEHEITQGGIIKEDWLEEKINLNIKAETLDNSI